MLAKIESADSVAHLEEILDAVDGAMVCPPPLFLLLAAPCRGRPVLGLLPIGTLISSSCLHIAA